MPYWLCRHDDGSHKLHSWCCPHSPGAKRAPGKATFSSDADRWLRIEAWAPGSNAEKLLLEGFESSGWSIANCCVNKVKKNA